MVTRFREQAMGHQVVTLDPARAAEGGFNALDWIDPASPLAESHIEAVVGWISGEARNQLTSGAEFFRESGKGLIACLLAHIIWDPNRPPEKKTLRELRRLLVTPEDEMRELLKEVHAHSASSMARDLAGTLKGLVKEPSPASTPTPTRTHAGSPPRPMRTWFPATPSARNS
jgi:type IV secretion system protein VirD4